jgi:hypothetical protein
MSVPSQEYVANNVPASPQSSNIASDTSQQLERIFSQNSQDLQKLAVAATTPIAGGHANAVPSSMMRPDSPYTAPTLDHREVVGAGNARAQGIGNSVKSVASLLSNVEIAKQNKTKNEVASATQQLLTAQAGYDQAQQVLKQDPNNADAKAAMERNKASMNGILSNDKLRKQISKGFNIDFTDPQANKTLEHEGVAQGKKMAQDHLDYAEQFNQKTPVQMGPNVIAQQQYAAALQQRKDQIETVRAMGPVWAAQLRAQGQLDTENIRAATDLRKASIEAGAKLDEQISKNYQADKDNAARMALEQYKASAARSLESMKAGKPIDVLKEFNEAQKNYETGITENQKSRQALNNELDKNPGSSRSTEIRRQLQALDAVDEQAKNAFLLNRNVIAKGLGISVDDTRLQIPTIHVGEGVGNAPAAGANTPSPDLDPRTGKPWKSGISTTDRILIKGHYGAGILQHDTEQVIGNINKGVKKLEHFFEPGDNKD